MGGATLPVAVLRRRGCAGRFAPLPDVGRAPRAAAPAGRAAGRPGAVRGAGARRPDDADGAAGLRAVDVPGIERAGAGFAADLAAVVPAVPAFLAADPFAVAAFVPLPEEPFAGEPFAPDPACFFAAALPFAGVLPVAPFAPEEPVPEPVRGVDDGRAPEPRAEPEGRAGRREEGMGRLCRFAGPLYRHYLRRAVCRSRGTQELSDPSGRVRRTDHSGDLYV